LKSLEDSLEQRKRQEAEQKRQLYRIAATLQQGMKSEAATLQIGPEYNRRQPQKTRKRAEIAVIQLRVIQHVLYHNEFP
jgi:hypothetical protein